MTKIVKTSYLNVPYFISKVVKPCLIAKGFVVPLSVLKAFSPIQLIQENDLNPDRYSRFLGVGHVKWHVGVTETMTDKRTNI